MRVFRRKANIRTTPRSNGRLPARWTTCVGAPKLTLPSAAFNVRRVMTSRGAAQSYIMKSPLRLLVGLAAVMGADQGSLKLVTVPEVKSIADLRGKTVSVDARTTGYAFVLFEILERNGLREPDYKVERAGGVLQRFQALMEKKHDGTLLLSPFEVQAEARGFNTLASASQVLGPYQGLVAGVRRSWAEKNGEALTGYIRAYVRAVEWLYDPANKAETIAVFRKNLPNMPAEGVEASYRLLLDPQT